MNSCSPFLVGITGGIGSGKSSLCSYLARSGCEVFEADRVAKELQQSNAVVIEGMQALFGKDIYSKDSSGALVPDRKRVAAEVFLIRRSSVPLTVSFIPKFVRSSGVLFWML